MLFHRMHNRIVVQNKRWWKTRKIEPSENVAHMKCRMQFLFSLKRKIEVILTSVHAPPAYLSTMEPRFNDLRYNDILSLTI